MSVKGFLMKDGTTQKYDYESLDNLPSGGGGLTEDVKQALLTCFENVAWIGDDGKDYYDALEAALYPPADLVSITAVFSPGAATIYNTDTLDDLKQYLTVTATYEDYTVETVSDYTLSGSLTTGTQTITVTYGGKTTTFTVTVEEWITSITAVYTQSGTVYDTDTLDSLKSDLVVTAAYADSSTAIIQDTDYTLTGTLAEGTSTVTVTYDGKTATFNVTVTVRTKNVVPWVGGGKSDDHTVTNNNGVYTLGIVTKETPAADYYQAWSANCTQGQILHLDFNNDNMVQCGVMVYVVTAENVILKENAVQANVNSGAVDGKFNWINTGFGKNAIQLGGDSYLTIPETGKLVLIVRGSAYKPDSATTASAANTYDALMNDVFDFYLE